MNPVGTEAKCGTLDNHMADVEVPFSISTRFSVDSGMSKVCSLVGRIRGNERNRRRCSALCTLCLILDLHILAWK